MSEPSPTASEHVGLERAIQDGGLLHRTLAGAGVERDAVAIAIASLVLATLTWAPLLVASLVEGLAFGEPGSFLRDAGVHVRSFVALPLLVVGERIVERRQAAALRYVENAGLVDESARERARAVAARIGALHGSVLVHAVLVLGVVAVSIAMVVSAPAVATWAYPEPSASPAARLSVAGWIDIAWSAAIYRLLIVRWLVQLALWALLLTQLARLPLRTSPLHHDGVGGLGPLVEAHQAFGWIVVASSCALAARLAVQVRLTHGDPFAYSHAIAGYCLTVPLVCLAPTLAFVVPLDRDRRRVMHQLAIASGEQARRFTGLYATPGQGRPLARGVDDVAIGADLTPSFERVYGMWRSPFRREHYVALVLMAAIPMLGFFAASLPLDDVLTALRGLLG